MKKVFLSVSAAALLLLCAVHASSGASAPGGPRAQDAQPDGAGKCSETPALLDGLYLQLLEHPAGPKEKDAYAAKLDGKELSVKELARELVSSPDYVERFFAPLTPEEAVGLLHQRLLARAAQTEDYERWVGVARTQGFKPVIDGLIDGAEYAATFGEWGVPGRPVRLRACRFPFKLRRSDAVSRDQEMTTELTISETGQIDAVTTLKNEVAAGGFCGKVGLWLLDGDGNVVERLGPSKERQWCVKGRGTDQHEQVSQWQAEIPRHKLSAVSAVAVLHSAGSRDPLGLTGENIAAAALNRRPFKD